MKKTKYIFLAAGIFILIILIKSFGIETTLAHLSNMGWRFIFIVLIFFFSNIVLTAAWSFLIQQKLTMKQFFILVTARIAGDSTSSINAVGAFAGEPLKAIYVKNFIPLKTGLASVILDRTAHTVANAFAMLTGVIISIFVLKLPPQVTVFALVLVTLFFIFIFFVIRKQKKGFLTYIINLLPGVMTQRILKGERADKIKAMDNEISLIISNRNKMLKFYFSVSLHYFALLIACTLEIFLIVYFIAAPAGFSMIDAAFLYIFGFILTSAMFFMPANMGTSEGSYTLGLTILGYNPALGVSIGIIRRFRTLTWAAIGIALLFHAGLTKNPTKRSSQITENDNNNALTGT